MKTRPPKQTSQYDKILKENLEAAIPALIKKVLGIDAVVSEEIPDDLQRTKERKPDALKRITDQAGNTFILHLEFQVANDVRMVHRMHTYCAMLLEKYEIPIRQYVFYLGPGLPSMPTSLVIGDLSFRYHLIGFQQLDYRLFLSSSIPEEIILAVLANFQPQDSSQVLNQLLVRLDETATGSLVFQRYLSQLRVLVQLRKLQPLLEAAMDNLTKYVNEQGDPFYIKGRNLGFVLGIEKGTEEGFQQGRQEGMQKGIQEGMQKGTTKAQHQLIKNLLTETDFSDEKIAKLTDVAIDVVRGVRQSAGSK